MVKIRLAIGHAAAKAINSCQPGIKSAFVCLDSRLVVKATKRHKDDGRHSRIEFVVTAGAPNYRERAFLKACRKAGEPFPVKPQLRPFPKKRKA